MRCSKFYGNAYGSAERSSCMLVAGYRHTADASLRMTSGREKALEVAVRCASVARVRSSMSPQERYSAHTLGSAVPPSFIWNVPQRVQQWHHCPNHRLPDPRGWVIQSRPPPLSR